MRGATHPHLHIIWVVKISTHTPHARCDSCKNLKKIQKYIFLLTHLMRGATPDVGSIAFDRYNFYSHTSCEVRPNDNYVNQTGTEFLLTHLMRGATNANWAKTSVFRFLLTHLMRGATYSDTCFAISSMISTHTPHARCDIGMLRQVKGTKAFLLTHLMRGATCIIHLNECIILISTHTPHARCDAFGRLSRLSHE